jgi:hypothetical protein
MRRLCLLSATTALTFALLAVPALAHDGGEGLYGPTDDKVVTNAGFIVIAFFPLFIFTMSMIQWRLDKRKERRKKAAKSLSGIHEQLGGW